MDYRVRLANCFNVHRNTFVIFQHPIDLILKPNFLLLQLVIPPYYMAVMRVEVQAPDTEGMFLGELKLTTKYEELKIPTQLRTVEGCLGIKPDHVIMKATFPVSLNEFHSSLQIKYQ